MFIATPDTLSKEALANLSYDEWKERRDIINNTVDHVEYQMHGMATHIIREKNLTVTAGLLPEEVRTNKRYIFLKKLFDKEFAILRMFNGNTPKKFSRRYSQEYRASKMKNKGKPCHS